MKDLRFTKEHAYCDFAESENDENIKSGESLGVIFGKIQKRFSNSGVYVTEGYLQNALKDLPKRYYGEGGVGGINITPITNGSNTVSGWGSVSSGALNKSTGECTVTMGYANTSSGTDGIAMGASNISTGNRSAAIGYSLIAAGENQTVLGKYNIADNNNEYVFILGNGTGKNCSNALTVDWDGKLCTAGDIVSTDINGEKVSLNNLKNMITEISELSTDEIDSLF